MTRTVEIPLWALLLLIGFAAVTFASHFLFPSVRWFFRRRMERAVERLNQRLTRPIAPFKLARRHDMIQRLLYDPDVTRAIVDHAYRTGVPEDVAFQQARAHAREIVPSFSASLYFGFAIRVARWLSQAVYDVRLSHADAPALQAADPDATLVFVMNHRSNMDYVLVTWLAGEDAALAYAVGEWARVWPLSRLIRATGAYFIRRRPRDNLYRRVLARYVRLATEAGVTQAVFPEGGLSLDGALGTARLGLLKYIVEGHDTTHRDVVFVPVSLNYDRVFEDRLLVAAARTRRRKFPARISVVARFVLRHFWRRLRGRDRHHGIAAVRFGRPLSLSAHRSACPDSGVRALADELMRRIGAEIPLLPVPLLARRLLHAPGPVAEADLLKDLPGEDVAAGRKALKILSGRGLIARCDMPAGEAAEWAPVGCERPLLAYYAASIRHLFCQSGC